MHEDDLELEVSLSKIMITLTKEQGETIKDLITDNYTSTFPWYCQKVGIATPNFYNVVNGQRPCSLEWLNKLLSGIQHEAILHPLLIIKENDPVIVPNETIIEELPDDYDEVDNA